MRTFLLTLASPAKHFPFILFVGMTLNTTRAHGQCYDVAFEEVITLGAGMSDDVCAVDFGPSGELYFSGGFEDAVDFDWTADTDIHTSNGISDLFLTRRNPEGSYGWTVTLGEPDQSEQGFVLSVDGEGNAYIGGTLQGVMDFDPGPDTDEYAPIGVRDGFVFKILIDGSYGWTATFGGLDAFTDTWVIDNDSEGNLYAAGTFQGTVDFDPTDGTDYRTNMADSDVFLVSLTSDGAYRWTIVFGGEGAAYADALAVRDESIVLSGCFDDTTDFDPGSDVDEYSAVGYDDAYVSKFSMDGLYLWTRVIGGPGDEAVLGAGIDSLSNVVITGNFDDTAVLDFDPTEGLDERASNGAVDMFVTTLNAEGSYRWTWTAGGTANDSGHGIAVDDHGSVFQTGWFGGDVPAGYEVDFDAAGDGDVHSNRGQRDISVTRLNEDGSYGWTYTFGGQDYEYSWGIAVNNLGDAVVAGDFRASVDFDPDHPGGHRTSNGEEDAFVLILSCLDNPPPCDGDVNGDSTIDPLDSGFVMSRFDCLVGSGDPECDAADANADLVVDPLDVGYVLSRFGECL